MTTVAVSPDGRWLAVGGWYEAGVRVWDMRRRRLECVLRPKDAVNLTKFFSGFSPDGRWLVSCTYPDGGEGDLPLLARGDVGPRPSDRPGATVGTRPPAFTSDGRLMALGIAARSSAFGRRRHRPGACAADDIAAGDPDAARLQPRRHETGCKHEPKDRAGVGPAADPRAARPAGTGLGRAAVSDRFGRERRPWSSCPRRGRYGSSAKSSSPGLAAPLNWPR